MERIGERAVVIGAGIGGLTAARALADAFETVTIVERDELPEGTAARRAVPQGRHCHALLPGGLRALDELYPGISDEMIAAGAPTYEALTDFRFSIGGHELARTALGRTGVTASRPFIEGHVRRRTLALPNVDVIDRCDALGLTGGDGGGRVTGVRALGRADGSAEQRLEADLVVASTGRAARVPAWLEALGYGRPEEEELRVDIVYASRAYRLPEGALADRMVLIGARPGLPRGMALFAQEGGRWLLTLNGYGRHRPPADPEGFDEFLASVAPPDVLAAVRAAEPLSGIDTFRFPANRRRRYEQMRLPDGLLVIGDAICSFNPIYGQGMTVAAMEAAALRECLRGGGRRLSRRYLRRAVAIVDDAWKMAAGADLALPEVEGKRPAPVRLVNAYMRRLHATASSDPLAAAALLEAGGLLRRPQSVMRPAVARRVLLGGRRAAPWPGRGLARPLRRRALEVGGVRTPLREAGNAEAAEAVVFVHGVPGSGADWEPLLAALGGGRRAVAWDAPGFGRAEAPRGFRQSIAAHGSFIRAALEELGIERAHLVMHDFGALWGLSWASEEPGRLASATMIGGGLLPGYRWHRLARIWRTPLVGEAFMRATTRAGFRASLRRGAAAPLPEPLVERMYRDLDARTRAAILELYRSVDDVDAESRRLAAALRPRAARALVVWGDRDPYLPAPLAARQRDGFPTADVHVLEGCGHWPFVERAGDVERLVADFLAAEAGSAAEEPPSPSGEAAPAARLGL